MAGSRRIVSLLPGLTDTVLALGEGASLVGISHECEVPDGWPVLPRLTRCKIDPAVSSEAIHEQVCAESGGDLYELDLELLKELRPDLVLTQSQCDVCAVNEQTVADAVAQLPNRPRFVSVNPTTLSGVFAMIRDLGDVLARRHEAESVIRHFEDLEQGIDRHKAGLAEKSVVHLEWLDPVMGSGHWNPELIRIAGGHEKTSLPGVPSRVLPTGRIREAFSRADHVILGACGFPIERTIEELNRISPDKLLVDLLKHSGARCWVVDGNRNLVRPGPRLLTSLMILGQIISGINPPEKIQVGDLDLSVIHDDFGEITCDGQTWSVRL